jgi:diacylglycerol O-acyltransferase
MSQTELRRRMRGADAMFLYFERKEMPLHIGSVAILDGPFDQECERMIEARLPEIPRYRQRVLFPPFNVSHPVWEDDPAFDFRNHLRRVCLDPPGTEQQLSDLSGRIFTPLMDRNRPLWDLTVVDGLEGGRSALITRVHHSMVDGISGIGLMNIMFDPTRTPRKVEPRPFAPAPLPDSGQLLVEGLASGYSDVVERLLDLQVTFLRMAQSFLGETAMTSLRGLLASAPEIIRPTERLPFNRPCSGVRGHCWTTFSFEEARQIRAAVGGTINDVALTTVAGAISKYVAANREPVQGRFARLLVPVNVRAENSREPGNEISMLPLSVPLDIEDPVERMRAITLRSAAMKSARVADLVTLIGTWLGAIPPSLQTSLAALPFMPQPVLIVNLVCTNVPGPMIPLYTNGRELLTYYPHVPCGSDVGIGVAIQSYNRKLYYGVTYDMQAAPDGELFRDFLIESYEELRNAAGVRPSEAPRAQAAPPPAVRREDLRSHRAPPPPAVETTPRPEVKPEAAAAPAVAPLLVETPLEPPAPPVVAAPPPERRAVRPRRPLKARARPPAAAAPKQKRGKPPQKRPKPEKTPVGTR